MDVVPNTFKVLMKIAGKILFVIGLVLNICMIFFGFWPSLVYLLIMLAGAGMITLNKDTGTSSHLDAGANWIEKSFNTMLVSLKNVDKEFAKDMLKKITITLMIVFALCISVLIFGQDYFKKRDTISSCREITAALQHYKLGNKTYPVSLSVLAAINPMLSNLTKDKWGNPYQYVTENNGSHFQLISAGKDGKFKTDDDLVFKN